MVKETQVVTKINSHKDKHYLEFFKCKQPKQQCNTNKIPNVMVSFV